MTTQSDLRSTGHIRRKRVQRLGAPFVVALLAPSLAVSLPSSYIPQGSNQATLPAISGDTDVNSLGTTGAGSCSSAQMSGGFVRRENATTTGVDVEFFVGWGVQPGFDARELSVLRLASDNGAGATVANPLSDYVRIAPNRDRGSDAGVVSFLQGTCGVTNVSIIDAPGPFPPAFFPGFNRTEWTTATVDMTYTVQYTQGGIEYEHQFGYDVTQTAYVPVNRRAQVLPPDTTPPTPTVAADGGTPTLITTLDPFTAQVTFDENINDFDDLTDVTVINGTLNSIVPTATPNVFTVNITPDGNGDVGITVPINVATDDAGNDNLVSNTLTVPLDDTPPTPTVAGDGGTPAVVTDLTPFTVQVTFDEDINDFDDLPGDVTVTNGTATSITPTGTPNVFTVSITPDGNGNIGITVPANVATDDVGNDNLASNTFTVPFDDMGPTPTVAADAGTPPTITDLTPFTVEVTFDEDINDFGDVLSDVIVTNGTVDAITPTGTPNVFTITITPTSNADVSISVPAAVATDDAGNDNVVSNVFVIVNEVDDTNIAIVERVLEDDLLVTTRMITQSASNISRRAADRLRFDRGEACVVEINDLLRTSPVRFASDSFFIDASNTKLLDDIALALSKCETASFMIAGHTDSDASDAYNITLSQNRVDAVKAALVSRGIASNRLQTRGFGESRPIATNATEEGQALNRRVEFILLDGGQAAEPACGDGRAFGGNLDGGANDAGASVNADFGGSGYDCVTGEHTETWGRIDVVRNDEIGTQGMATFGISKERQTGNTLRGRFIEGYVSRKEVDTDEVDGTITGVGVHAGLFGAHAAENGLVLSYYGSAAVGRHAFDLDAVSNVDGNYTYAGIFAGGAVTGERATDALIFKPRAGIDLGYSRTIGSDISSTGSLDIEPATYARGFVELGLIRETEQGGGALELAPRVFCETNDDADADACGFGGRINYEGALSDAGTQWNAEFDYETIDDTDRASFAVTRTQSVMNDLGVSKSSLGASAGGAFEIAQTFSFNW